MAPLSVTVKGKYRPDQFQTSLLFRKGSERAGTKPRITDSPSQASVSTRTSVRTCVSLDFTGKELWT